MSATEQTIIRVDKEDGSRTAVYRHQALADLATHYIGDVRPMLDAATEAHPAETPFALYWPVAATERTAGETIAHAMWLFNGGTIGQVELAKAIDDALKAYR